jgi:hypothetical protein
MDEQHDRAVAIAALRVEQVKPMALARSIGQIQLAARTLSISSGIPLPARNMDGVIGNAGPVIVLGLQVEFFGCPRDCP